MKIESISIKTITASIFLMLGVVAVVLSMAAGSYFKQAALNAQLESLTRVNEIASHEVFHKVRKLSYEIAMQLGHTPDLVAVVKKYSTAEKQRLIQLLDDPFINGFAGYAEIDLVKLRVYDLKLALIAQSSKGFSSLPNQLNQYLADTIGKLSSIDRLKAQDALWISTEMPLYSTIVPLGGLHPVGYLEVVVDPAFNLVEIEKITHTPVHVYKLNKQTSITQNIESVEDHLPIEYIVYDSGGLPAYKIIGYENVSKLNQEMNKTQWITISGFLVLTMMAMMFALWLFKRFLFSPVSLMIRDIGKITSGKLNLSVNNQGLKEFSILANAFNTMTEQVRLRTSDLQQLLNLDESALICFDYHNEAVYFNKAATHIFGYQDEEVSDLEIGDLFANDISLLINQAYIDKDDNVAAIIECIHKDGHLFKGQISIKPVSVLSKNGLAVVINTNVDDKPESGQNDDQRFRIFEQTLKNLFVFSQAKNHVVLSAENTNNHSEQIDQGANFRQQAVTVMNLALNCWSKNLSKSKIDLAEESKIWPVYMDKSTPTTRTLDKYLNIEKCPKNPRHQRVIDTAQFVLNKTRHCEGSEREVLKTALDSYTQLLSGIAL